MCGKSSRLKMAISNQGSIILIHRDIEQAGCKQIEILMPVYAALLHQCHGFAKPLDHRGDQEIATQLYQISLFWIIRHNESALTQNVEQRLYHCNEVWLACGDHVKLACCGCIRPAEYGSCNIALLFLRVSQGKPRR